MQKHNAEVEIKSPKIPTAAPNEQDAVSSLFDRAKLVDLMEVFHLTVIEVASFIESGETLSTGDIEDGRYVAGVATVSAANCEMLLAVSESEEKNSLALYNQFMSEAEKFALAIKSSGLIKESDDVIFY